MKCLMRIISYMMPSRGHSRIKEKRTFHRKLELNLKRNPIWHVGVVQTLFPKKDCTRSQHDGVCFLFSNFLPHKPIPRNTFMGKTFEFTLGDSWVRPKSTFSNTKGNNEYPLHIYMGGPLPPAPGMPGL